jgi:hypothetical protein
MPAFPPLLHEDEFAWRDSEPVMSPVTQYCSRCIADILNPALLDLVQEGSAMEAAPADEINLPDLPYHQVRRVKRPHRRQVSASVA